jgi:allophanate hydrolase
MSFLAPAARDAELANLAAAVQAQTQLPLGALGGRPPAWPPPASRVSPSEVVIAGTGAHRLGMPLNHELSALGARYLECVWPDYRLFLLSDAEPLKPGLLRVKAGAGAEIELETWALSAEGFGRFVASLPPPMSIGTLRLRGGDFAKGFLVAAQCVAGARDISRYGSWPAFLAAAS